MTYINKNPHQLQAKLYGREFDFKSFQDITEEKLAEIAKKVYRREEIKTYSNPSQNNNLIKYIETLEYLTNQPIHHEIPSFDERILFLIMSVDPNLVTFKEFLKLNIPSVASIDELTDPKEQEKLTNHRQTQLGKYKTNVRSILGFFDIKLLKFEEKYFNRFLNQKELLTDINQDNTKKFLALRIFMEPFSTITTERYLELQSKAQIWLSLTNQNGNLQTAIYSVLKQKDLIGLDNLAECYTFFILVTDPELDMLKIYEEESRTNIIQKRIIEAFGYYHQEMISLEREYHQAFCPEKQISIWSK